MKDIYKSQTMPVKKADPVTKLLKAFDEVKQRVDDLESKKEVSVIAFPEKQKVEITNPADPVVFPTIQKVEVINNDPVVFPTIQKVTITNPTPITPAADLKNIEALLHELVKKEIPQKDIQKVKITNQPEFNFPTGNGDKPGSANPSYYVPVRLTNGKRFYSALEDAFVTANQKAFPFVNAQGTPQAALVNNDGTLPIAAPSFTTTSGLPLFAYQTNIPTVQSVFVTNPSSGGGGVVTSVSGTQHAIVDNFPTVQTVTVNNPTPAVTTTSGTPLDVTIRNLPTVQTVNVQNFPTSTITTSVSGTQHSFIDNFPTVQNVGANITQIGGIPIAPAQTLADGMSPSKTNLVGSVLYAYNGGGGDNSYDRVYMYAPSDSDNNDRAVVTQADNKLWNSSSSKWVRALGDATNGAFVQVKNTVTVSGVNTGWNSVTTSGVATTSGATSIKASAGTFGGYYIYNPNASVAYLQVFNQTSVTLGTTKADMSFGIPPLGAANLIFPIDAGRPMGRGIMIAATTTMLGNTPPSIGLDVTTFYN